MLKVIDDGKLTRYDWSEEETSSIVLFDDQKAIKQVISRNWFYTCVAVTVVTVVLESLLTHRTRLLFLIN
jgi:hypothetical protein